MRRAVAIAVALAAAALALWAARPRHRPPNIVLIVADDLGYGDLGAFGATDVRTPAIDRLATEGARLTRFYTAAPTCSPARAALLTGRIPLRTGVDEVLGPRSTWGLPTDEVTLAEALRDAGYATQAVGKWHLGHQPGMLPLHHGFDGFLGVPYSNDMDPFPLLSGDDVLQPRVDQHTLVRRYTDAAVAFIRANAERPFFLYVAHNAPHTPLRPSEAFAGRSARGKYGDAVEELDASVGEILAALAERHLDDDTLVVFTSDNGPWLVQGESGGSPGPLRSGKGTVYEGGVRMPTAVRWPGHIPPATIAAPTASVDLFPTLIALAGGRIPADRPIDGEDLGPLLLGAGARPDGEVALARAGELEALIDGRYKLLVARPGARPAAELYDVDADPGEAADLAATDPARVDAMTTRLLAIGDAIAANRALR